MNSQLTIALAKILACAAWIDNDLANEEMSMIKEMVLSTGQVEDEEWYSVKIYFEYPPTEEELYKAISDEVLKPKSNFIAVFIEMLKRYLRVVLQKKRDQVNLGFVGRERNLSEFIYNPVFFRLSHEIEKRRLHVYFQKLDKQILRKYSLMGAILGRAFSKNPELFEDATGYFLEELTKDDVLSPEAALIVAEIALTRSYNELDILRICREFFDMSTDVEKIYLVKQLVELTCAYRCLMGDGLDYLHQVAAHLKVPTSYIEEGLLQNCGHRPKHHQNQSLLTSTCFS